MAAIESVAWGPATQALSSGQGDERDAGSPAISMEQRWRAALATKSTLNHAVPVVADELGLGGWPDGAQSPGAVAWAHLGPGRLLAEAPR